MQIKSINCKARFSAMGIDINAIGSGSLLIPHLPVHESWEYDYLEDTLVITVANDTVIPDMSNLGEVLLDGSPTE